MYGSGNLFEHSLAAADKRRSQASLTGNFTAIHFTSKWMARAIEVNKRVNSSNNCNKSSRKIQGICSKNDKNKIKYQVTNYVCDYNVDLF